MKIKNRKRSRICIHVYKISCLLCGIYFIFLWFYDLCLIFTWNMAFNSNRCLPLICLSSFGLWRLLQNFRLYYNIMYKQGWLYVLKRSDFVDYKISSVSSILRVVNKAADMLEKLGISQLQWQLNHPRDRLYLIQIQILQLVTDRFIIIN